MLNETCKFEYLFSSIYGDVSLCRGCRMVHLDFSNLSMRFDIEDFLGVSDTLAEASKVLRIKMKETKGPKHLSLIKKSH
jgi:hypothetical protein